MTNLLSSFQEYDDDVKKNNPTYSGLLGLTINGSQQVEHPTRNGFVYFRFRDNLSEVVLAFNDKVSPVYGLPVVVERVGNNWRVIGRDTDRYSNWGSSAPYLPKHGFQHSFNRDEGTGGDVVLVYPDQFVPLLVYPSGSFGAGNLQVASYLLQRDSDFIYVGNTGTQNILPYKPTGSSAIMGLVYLDTTTGNPGLLINSGTPFNSSITGTAGVSPYIPYPSSTQEPLYAFRLVSGTSALTWDNLYNARQFIGGGQGGSASTGTFIPTGTYMDLTTNQVAAGVKRFSDSIQIGIEPPAAESDGGLSQASEGASVANFLWTWGAGFASFITGLFARGTKASPTAALKDDVMFRWRARAYDGTTYGNTSVEIRGVADEDHNSSGHGTRLEVWATPTGTTTLTKMMTVESSGSVNIGSGTYNINGVPVGGSGGITSGPQSFTDNLKLSVTVASNNITVAIKTIAGADPSASSPVRVRIGDTYRSITSALSVTKNAGTNWCNAGGSELATKEIDYFVYLGYNATDGVVLGFSRIPYAKRYDDFNTTTTNEKYAAISTITNAAAGDYYENIGRFAATLSGGAGYTWTVPTFTASNLINRPIYETRILVWVPTTSASGSMTWTSVSISIAEYQIIGRQVSLEALAIGTTGGSASNVLYMTVPFDARNASVFPAISAYVGDNGGKAAIAYIEAATPDKIGGQRYDAANFGLGTLRYLDVNGKYTI